MPRPKAAKAQAAPAEEQVAAPAAEEASVSQAQEGAAPAKKKRNNNPGVRVQGGRVYDSENGTTCHQCRQKTIETKAKCTKCTLYFCPKCLENRYQEKVEDANATAGWACPRCRGECNCSNCRKKAGKEATGQLANIAKKAGFGSVRDLLEKNPHAKALQLPKLPPGSSTGAGGSRGAAAAGGKASREGSAAAEGSEGGEEGGSAAAGAQRKRPAQKRKAVAEEAEKELVPDEQLPPRATEMPEARRPAVHKAPAGAAAGAKRPRGGLAWSADVPDAVELPEGEAGAELAAILEFLQVFGGKIRLRSPPLAALAAELLQPATEDAAQLLCPAAADSLVGLVHCRLLEVVRAYWNVKGDVRPGAWQGIMRGYYAASLLTQRQALDLRWQHGPPAVAGEIFSRPVAAPTEEEGAGEAPGTESMEVDGEAVPVLGAGGAAAVATVDYPAGSYWGLQPAVRVAMLHALVHDALETDELRKAIEESMGDALDEEKERRQQLAGVRKEARAAIQRERDQQIALMIANAATGGLTLEQQQAMLEEARQRAEAAASSAAAAKLMALGEKVHPPTVRAAVVGTDREGRRYLQLQAAPLLTGGGGIVVQCCGPEGPSARCSAASGGADSSGAAEAEQREAYGCYPAEELVAVAAALHPQGLREGPLRAALLHAFKLPKEAVEAASGEEQQTQVQTQQQQGEAAAEEEPTVEADAAEGASQQQQQGEAQPAAATAVIGDGAPAPAGKKGSRGRKRAAAPAKPAEPAGGAAPEPAAVKRGAKQAGGRGGKGKASPAAAAAVAEAAAEPAAAKQRRSGSQGADAEAARPGGKRQKASAEVPATEEPAAGQGSRRSARRASPAAAAGGKAAGGKAAGRRGRKAAAAGDAQLPLKVDDMLVA